MVLCGKFGILKKGDYMPRRKNLSNKQLFDLSEEDMKDETIQQMKNMLQQCCCNFCGGEVVLKKPRQSSIKNAENEIDVVQICEKCGLSLIDPSEVWNQKER
jgi:hypothetical protein